MMPERDLRSDIHTTRMQGEKCSVKQGLFPLNECDLVRAIIVSHQFGKYTNSKQDERGKEMNYFTILTSYFQPYSFLIACLLINTER